MCALHVVTMTETNQECINTYKSGRLGLVVARAVS